MVGPCLFLWIRRMLAISIESVTTYWIKNYLRKQCLYLLTAYTLKSAPIADLNGCHVTVF